ncbi:MAG: tyrosine-type recombinase/integrase [Solirubrobacterales bacterium]
MPRPATGQVIVRDGKRGRVFSLRFRCPYGSNPRPRITLGTAEDGWTRERAEAELRHVLAQVELEQWKPPIQQVPETEPDQTFHEFASEWFNRHRPEWRDRTAGDYGWALSYHLLPAFKDHRLSEITVEGIERYKADKLREGRLCPATINKTLTRLGQILDEARRWGRIDSNPARDALRLKAAKPQRSWVEPEQLMTLLAACSPLHRPIIATLAGGGFRVSEACALDWRDVNVLTGTITVHEAKTDAGSGRQVELPLGAMDELRAWWARTPSHDADDPVFVAGPYRGRYSRQTKDNVGRRLKVAIRKANPKLIKVGIDPISERVSPHSLRRTYASLRYGLRDDPIYVAEQGGWSDMKFPMEVYARALRRRERLSGAYLAAYDAALQWATMGQSSVPAAVKVAEPSSELTPERA